MHRRSILFLKSRQRSSPCKSTAATKLGKDAILVRQGIWTAMTELESALLWFPISVFDFLEYSREKNLHDKYSVRRLYKVGTQGGFPLSFMPTLS